MLFIKHFVGISYHHSSTYKTIHFTLKNLLETKNQSVFTNRCTLSEAYISTANCFNILGIHSSSLEKKNKHETSVFQSKFLETGRYVSCF
jgi:hypothetical protein